MRSSSISAGSSDPEQLIVSAPFASFSLLFQRKMTLTGDAGGKFNLWA